LGTVPIAISRFGKGINKDIDFLGSGISFKITFVTIPKVPSDPQIKSFMLYPEEFLTTFPPRLSISPFGSIDLYLKLTHL
jgi:hypothetical protein